MYNDSVIQEQSGLNAFYNKIYSLVGIGVGISALVSGLMMTVFQDFFVQILTTAPMVYYAAVVVELILVFVASGKDVYCHGSYRTRREKRPVWNGTCLDGSLDRCDHCFCCEHVLEKFWNGLYLEYYLCLPLCRIDSLG